MITEADEASWIYAAIERSESQRPAYLMLGTGVPVVNMWVALPARKDAAVMVPGGHSEVIQTLVQTFSEPYFRQGPD